MCLAPVPRQRRPVDMVSTWFPQTRPFLVLSAQESPWWRSEQEMLEREKKRGEQSWVLEIIHPALESHTPQPHHFLSEFMPTIFTILICEMGPTSTPPLQRLPCRPCVKLFTPGLAPSRCSTMLALTGLEGQLFRFTFL